MTIVTGYLPVDRLPRRIRALGFSRRVAFVLDSYRPDKVDMYFDAELYAALLEAVREVFAADRLVSVSPSGATKDLRSASDVMRLLEPEIEWKREPLEQVMVRRGSATVAAIGSEPWANVGGPRPYDDSYTIPIYSAEDLAEGLEAAARSTCRRLGAEITEVVRGGTTPVPSGILSRLRDWLGIA